MCRNMGGKDTLIDLVHLQGESGLFYDWIWVGRFLIASQAVRSFLRILIAEIGYPSGLPRLHALLLSFDAVASMVSLSGFPRSFDLKL